MKTNLIFLLSLLLTGFFFDASAFSTFASTRKKQQNIQIESVKKQIFPPQDSLKTHENRADSLPEKILDLLDLDIQIKGYRPKIIHITTDGGYRLDHSPFELSQQKQDSVKKAQRKIIAKNKRIPFKNIDKNDKEALIIAHAKLTLLTHAPGYYREGPNVLPPLIGEEKTDLQHNRPYLIIRFSYNPEQEAHYIYLTQWELAEKQKQPENHLIYCGETVSGYSECLNLYPNVWVSVWTDTGQVKGINVPHFIWNTEWDNIWKMPRKKLKKLKFKYPVAYIKDDKLREQLEEQRRKQIESSK